MIKISSHKVFSRVLEPHASYVQPVKIREVDEYATLTQAEFLRAYSDVSPPVISIFLLGMGFTTVCTLS